MATVIQNTTQTVMAAVLATDTSQTEATMEEILEEVIMVQVDTSLNQAYLGVGAKEPLLWGQGQVSWGEL